MPLLVLTETVVENAPHWREHTGIFLKAYMGAIGYKPSYIEITCHLECMEQSNIVSWITASDHYKADELARRGLQLVKSTNTNRYHWLAVKAVGTPSILNTAEFIVNIDIMVGNPSNWSILLVGPKERICSFL